ncbi:MAG: hypothetical protein ACRDYA_10420 [Egibacteraceae bacterium]
MPGPEPFAAAVRQRAHGPDEVAAQAEPGLDELPPGDVRVVVDRLAEHRVVDLAPSHAAA